MANARKTRYFKVATNDMEVIIVAASDFRIGWFNVEFTGVNGTTLHWFKRKAIQRVCLSTKEEREQYE